MARLQQQAADGKPFEMHLPVRVTKDRRLCNIIKSDLKLTSRANRVNSVEEEDINYFGAIVLGAEINFVRRRGKHFKKPTANARTNRR